MKKCRSCHISFNTTLDLCPLCQNYLEGNNKVSSFPKNIKQQTDSLVFKILLFFSIVIIIISSFIEFYFIGKFHYSMYVNFGILSMLILIKFVLKNYQNVLKMFLKYGVIVLFLMILWYFITKEKIITNYIIPSICIIELIYTFIIGLVMSRRYLINYSNLVFMNILMLLAPFILAKLKVTTNNLMSYICLILAFITIAGLIIFYKEDIKDELKKIFNI